MQKIAKEINEEYKDEGTFGVVYQPGLTGFKESSSPFGQGYLSGLDWYGFNTPVKPVAANSAYPLYLFLTFFTLRSYSPAASIQTSAPTRSWRLRCGMYVIVRSCCFCLIIQNHRWLTVDVLCPLEHVLEPREQAHARET